jgi:lysophospholipase L1-like esterase
MKSILCYGDSNTWGWNPIGAARFDRATRWTGVLQQELGDEYYVIEEGLPGRATVWDDPVEGHMSGKAYLVPCLNSHKPLDLVVLMLGTNDLKYRFSATAYDIAEGIKSLIQVIQNSEAGVGGAAPRVLVVVPPPLGRLTDFSEMLSGGYEKSLGLAAHYRRVTDLTGCAYLDSSAIITPSDVDGVHYEASEHKKLGQAVAQKTVELLPRS